ncbi:hypothetical protein ACWGB8_34985 [Kitasatospora sp. NPDC054939]
MGGRQRPPRARGPRRRETRVEIARLEGYLAWEAEVSAAERDAAEFVGRFPWLPPEERASLQEAYAQERLRYAEEVVDRAVERCRQLAGRYRRECREICARWAALCFLVMAASVALGILPFALHA